MPLSRTTDATAEPVTLAEVKAYLRVTHDVDNTELEQRIIPAARQWCETFTCRAFLTQTWVLTLKGFCDQKIWLPKPPLISVSSITYLDENDASQTWASTEYDVITPSGDYAGHSFVTPSVSQDATYPTVNDADESVTVTYTAGYGAAASTMPWALKHAVRMVCDDLYSGHPDHERAEAVLWPFRVCRPDLRYE